jgi:signal transduction histidine kinase
MPPMRNWRSLEPVFARPVSHTLSTSQGSAAGGRVTCRFTVEGQRVEIVVSNNGCGIRPEEQASVFERLCQADASRSGDSAVCGTGVDLAIANPNSDSLSSAPGMSGDYGR